MMFKWASVLAFAALCGCVSVDREAEKAVAALRGGDFDAAAKWSAELAEDSSYSRNLGLVESGRVQMLAGNLPDAERNFRAAIDAAIDRKEAAPKIKFGDVGNTVLASTVTDDRTRQYYLAPYEINLALEYAILVEEAQGKREDALVDARLSVYVQDNLAETYGNDVKHAEEDSKSDAKAVCASNEQNLQELIASTRNSWENPVLWWVTGLLFEADGEKDFAVQSFRKAAAIRPQNPFFAADAARGESRVMPATDKARLAIVYGESFVSRRRSVKVPVPVYTGMSIDIPTYSDAAHVPRTVVVSVDGGAPLAASPALDVQSLAARDLKEHMPGIVTRNITRAAVQAGAQAAVNAAGNDYAKIAMFVVNAIVSAFRRADVRSWVTLPMCEQVWCDGNLTPGEHEVKVTSGRSTATIKVQLKPGETKIIYISAMEE